MKRIFYFLLLLTAVLQLPAQSKFNERINSNAENDTWTLDLAAGDTLVYEVQAGGKTYPFIVMLKEYDPSEKGISFDWRMTGAVEKAGSVHITSEALMNSRSYINFFSDGPVVLKEASTVFFTYENFMDMPQKKTKLNLDGKEFTFYRPEKDEVPYKVKVGGLDYSLDGFQLNNQPDGKGDKTMVIQGISSCALILRMDIGFVVELKEVK